MPRRKAGNREFDFAYNDAVTGIRTRGTGGWPWPHATYGGEVVLVVDVDVPNVGFGDTVDWTVPYPELGAGPVADLPIFRYGNPIDTSAKLHGKGSFEIDDVAVYAGSAVTGSGQPNTLPPEAICAVQIDLVLNTGGSGLWEYAGNMPTDLTVAYTRIVPTSSFSPKLIGNDVGKTSVGFRFANTSVGTNLVAGRLRVVLRGHEV